MAADKVRDRLLRASSTMEKASVPYAIIGGNAVAAWVGQVDPSVVRLTQDVDLLIRRVDFDVSKKALEDAGFIYRHSASMDRFLDGPDARARDAVHIVFSGEKVRPEHLLPATEPVSSPSSQAFRVLELDLLVRMKLTAFRDKDRTHLRDLIEVGLLDTSWIERVPAELADRLRMLLETPDG